MATAVMRFYEELNDLLPPHWRKCDIPLQFQAPCPVRHLIETCVPHTEVELVLLGGQSVGLEAPVRDGDRVSVYPMFESLDVSPLVRLRDRPLREPRFVADAHLGRLARYLRLLGFDTLFQNDPGDALLASQAGDGRRILLTRDRALLMRREVTHGCYIRPCKPLEQLTYTLGRCDLYRLVRPFTRCMECNGLLEQADKQSVRAQVPVRSLTLQERFWRCRGCGKVYWCGSHCHRLERLVEELLHNRHA